MQPCNGLPKPFMGSVEIPNCHDPVFRAWCKACGLTPGELVQPHDVRIAQLEQLMQGYDLTYDPESDYADDFLRR